MNNSASTCGCNGKAHLRACSGFLRKDNAAAAPGAAVCCSTSGQTGVIYPAFPAQGPRYLTGKVKAHSPEAIPERSTSSLGTRDGGGKRRKARFCSSGRLFLSRPH